MLFLNYLKKDSFIIFFSSIIIFLSVFLWDFKFGIFQAKYLITILLLFNFILFKKKDLTYYLCCSVFCLLLLFHLYFSNPNLISDKYIIFSLIFFYIYLLALYKIQPFFDKILNKAITLFILFINIIFFLELISSNSYLYDHPNMINGLCVLFFKDSHSIFNVFVTENSHLGMMSAAIILYSFAQFNEKNKFEKINIVLFTFFNFIFYLSLTVMLGIIISSIFLLMFGLLNKFNTTKIILWPIILSLLLFVSIPNCWGRLYQVLNLEILYPVTDKTNYSKKIGKKFEHIKDSLNFKSGKSIKEFNNKKRLDMLIGELIEKGNFTSLNELRDANFADLIKIKKNVSENTLKDIKERVNEFIKLNDKKSLYYLWQAYEIKKNSGIDILIVKIIKKYNIISLNEVKDISLSDLIIIKNNASENTLKDIKERVNSLYKNIILTELSFYGFNDKVEKTDTKPDVKSDLLNDNNILIESIVNRVTNNRVIYNDYLESIKKMDGGRKKINSTLLSTINVTTIVHLNHYMVALTSLTIQPLGYGFQNYKTAAIDFAKKNKMTEENKDTILLNINDGSNNFNKLIVEFGYFNILLIILFFKFFLRTDLNNNSKIFIFTILITQMLRAAGYFNGGFIFVVIAGTLSLFIKQKK